MNSVHLHLIATHLPILGSFFGLCLLVLARIQSNGLLARTSLWVLLLAGVAAIPTYLTGRPASVLLMKRIQGISLDASDQHAEVAVVALAAICVVGVVAAAGLVLYRKQEKPPGGFTAITLLLAVISTALMAWTASLGGNIRHTEIHDPAPSVGR